MGSPAIFSGNFIKFLTKNVRFNDTNQTEILTDTGVPSSTAPNGSLALSTNGRGYVRKAGTWVQIQDPSDVSAAITAALASYQPAGNYITSLTGNVTATGPGAAVATIAASAVTNAMLAGSIAYGKLTLTSSIVNADIAAAAAIAYSKLATLSFSRAVETNASGVVTASAVTSTELGYLTNVTSSVQTQLNAKQATGSYITSLTGNVTATGPGAAVATIQPGVVTNAMLAGSITYIKLILTGSVLDADLAGSISDSKLNTIATPGKVSNAATTATSANTAGAIIARDGAGNYAANNATLNAVTSSTVATGDIAIANMATLAKITSPGGSPAAGNILYYAKSDDNIYSKNSAGVEKAVAGITALTGNVTASGSGSVVATIAPGVIIDNNISNLAAIAYNKLNLSGSIQGSDFSAGAIYNSHINTAAAIAYSKLALTGAIVNADLVTISASGKVLNSATSATDANTANAIVARNSSGVIDVTAINATYGNLINLDVTNSNYHTTATLPSPGSSSDISFGFNTARQLCSRDLDGFYRYYPTSMPVAPNYVRNPVCDGSVAGYSFSGTMTFVSDPTNKLRGSSSFAVALGSTTVGAAGNELSTSFYNATTNAYTIDSIDTSRQLKVAFDFNNVGAAGDFAVLIYDNTGAAYITPSVSSVPGGKGRFEAVFATTTSVAYSLVFRRIAGSAALYFDNVFVGPQEVIIGPAVTGWKSYTPTETNKGTAVWSGNGFSWKQSGDEIIIIANITTTTVGSAAGTYTFSSPLPIDAAFPVFGVWGIRNSAINPYATFEKVPGSDSFRVLTAGSAAQSSDLFPSTSSPQLFVEVRAKLLNASANLQIANNNVEFASNSSTNDADDFTSFVYGPEGSQGIIGATALISERQKRVRFQTPVQPSDVLTIEVKKGSGNWVSIDSSTYVDGIGPLIYQNGVNYGIGISTATINSTDVNIGFGRYAFSNSTYGSAGLAWNTVAAYKWRVRKSAGVNVNALVGDRLGKSDGVAPAAGYIGETVSCTPSSQTFTATETDITGASLPISPGRWEVKYAVSMDVVSAVATSTATVGGVLITNAGVEVGNSYRVLYLKGNASFANETMTTLSCSIVIDTSSSITLKLRGKRTDIGTGTGAADFFNSATYKSNFYAVRIA